MDDGLEVVKIDRAVPVHVGALLFGFDGDFRHGHGDELEDKPHNGRSNVECKLAAVWGHDGGVDSGDGAGGRERHVGGADFVDGGGGDGDGHLTTSRMILL